LRAKWLAEPSCYGRVVPPLMWRAAEADMQLAMAG